MPNGLETLKSKLPCGVVGSALSTRVVAVALPASSSKFLLGDEVYCLAVSALNLHLAVWNPMLVLPHIPAFFS